MRYQIPNFSAYELDDFGNVYSKPRQVLKSDNQIQNVRGCVRKLSNHSTGYLTVILISDEGKPKTLRHHVLVAKILVPNVHNHPYVNHKDGNKHNNHPSNLEWVTAKENTAHAIQTGLMLDGKGISNNACRFTKTDVKNWVLQLKQGFTIMEIAKENNCNRNTISRLIKLEFPGSLPKYNGSVKKRFN